MKAQCRISVVIPAYNEENRLRPFIHSLILYNEKHPDHIHELIVVDDGSEDATASIAREMISPLPYGFVISLPVNQGKGAAVRAGVKASTGTHIVFMDADGATDISQISNMIAALEHTDIAVGNRWMQGSHSIRHSFVRRCSSWAHHIYMRMFGLGDIDVMCGFKGFSRQTALDLFDDLHEQRWLFDTEIIYKALLRGYSIHNFPILWTSKKGSKLTGRTLVVSALNILPLIHRVRKKERSKHAQQL